MEYAYAPSKSTKKSEELREKQNVRPDTGARKLKNIIILLDTSEDNYTQYVLLKEKKYHY